MAKETSLEQRLAALAAHVPNGETFEAFIALKGVPHLTHEKASQTPEATDADAR